jgi:diguanylate cyclase (GGDEF)-like protein/PAS domain S-box-containing protein
MEASSAVPCASVTPSGTVVRVDAAFVAPLGLTADELTGTRLDALGRTPADVAAIADFVTTAAGSAAARVQATLRCADDGELRAELVAMRHGDELTVVLIDETARVVAEQDLASSERRWLSLARNATDIVFTMSSAGLLKSVTSALPRQLGWAVEDVVGQPGLSFVHPDDRPIADALWLAVSRRESRQETIEVRLVHADGTGSWARLVITDLRDDPDVQAVVGNVTDITAQKIAENRRHHEETRFRARFDQSRLPQTMESADGTFEAVNDAFCQLVGRTRMELLGSSPTDIIHPDDVDAGALGVALLLERGVDFARIDRLLLHADGRPVPVHADLTLLRDEDGRPSGCSAAIQDLRPLRDSERARHELQKFFDVIAERSNEFATVHDADGEVIYASPAGLKLFGPSYEGAVAEHASAIHPDDLAAATAAWAYVREHSESHTWRNRTKGADGQWIWVEQTATNLLDTEVRGIVTTVRDVTDQVSVEQALRRSEARYRAMAETADQGIVVISPDGRVTYANARLASMLGLPYEAVLGTYVWTVLEGDAREGVLTRVDRRRSLGPEQYEVPYRHPDGSWRIMWVAASPMPDIDGEPQGSLAMISDVTESRRSADEFRRAAHHDHLTGLPNRVMLMEHLEKLDLPEVAGTAALFVDLDHFKDVNDGRGHTAGDDVLVEVAKRLTATVPEDALVARFGGDEFVIVLHDVDEEAAKRQGAAVLEALTQTFGIGHHAIRIGATIGIALSPAQSAEDLLRFADTAMYAAKAGGRGRLRLFDKALAEQAEERYVLGAELLTAIVTDGLEMKYQPVIAVSTGEVVGVEALARWTHPVYGEVSPSRFVALAELSASATDLDRWVIKRALRDVSELKADLTMPEDAYVSINLSGQSLSEEGLGRYIVEAVEEVGLSPDVVMLEITESAIMADKDIAIGVLRDLRDRGFDVAIDDFGTGYSSMAYLRDLPLSVLKIDRGFVRGIPHDAHSLAIVTSLIELARSLGVKVVAEGVETKEHLDALRTRGCGLAQGWLWSPALSVSELRSSKILTDRFGADDVWPILF